MRLSVEHQFFTSATFVEPAVLAAAALLLSGMVLLAFCRSRLPLFALLWSILFLLPASTVPLIVLVNEHRVYLSLVGGGLLLAWLFERVYRHRPRVAYGSLAVYVMVLPALAFSRGHIWANERQLWADAAVKGPLMLKPHLQLGDALLARGENAAAEQAYLRALALRPQHPATRNNLGLLNMRQGRLAEAEAHFRALLATSPDILSARLNLAPLLLRGGEWQQADRHYALALQYGDTEGDAQKN
jgi:tetratricopeptide (TPR) repeat protein